MATQTEIAQKALAEYIATGADFPLIQARLVFSPTSAGTLIEAHTPVGEGAHLVKTVGVIWAKVEVTK